MRCGRRLAARIHRCDVCSDGAKKKVEWLDQLTNTDARGSEQRRVAHHVGVFTKAETHPRLMNLGIDVDIGQARATWGAQRVALPMRTKSQWIEGHGNQCWRIRLSPTAREPKQETHSMVWVTLWQRVMHPKLVYSNNERKRRPPSTDCLLRGRARQSFRSRRETKRGRLFGFRLASHTKWVLRLPTLLDLVFFTLKQCEPHILSLGRVMPRLLETVLGIVM
jgi:hypothetical protein